MVVGDCMEICFNVAKIRTLVSMDTDYSHRLIMGNVAKIRTLVSMYTDDSHRVIMGNVAKIRTLVFMDTDYSHRVIMGNVAKIELWFSWTQINPIGLQLGTKIKLRSLQSSEHILAILQFWLLKPFQ